MNLTKMQYESLCLVRQYLCIVHEGTTLTPKALAELTAMKSVRYRVPAKIFSVGRPITWPSTDATPMQGKRVSDLCHTSQAQEYYLACTKM